MDELLMKKYNQIKNRKLMAALVIDAIGYLSYLVPAFGEATDVVWGPLSGVLIFILFPNKLKRALAGALEEMLPFTDFVPSAYLTWRQVYIKEGKKTLKDFLDHEIGQRQTMDEYFSKHKDQMKLED